jgi:N-sulfoglucosamine sulfohydrolase
VSVRALVLALVLVAALELAPAEGGAAAARRPDRPNILWISVEDMSPRLGAWGDPLARTPNIDALAGEGVRYTHAFTTAGVCAPSRSAIITGMYQNGIGTHHMRTASGDPGLPGPYEAAPAPFVKAFPEYLRAAGYFTTNSWKTDYQFGTPFTVWDESSRDAHWRSGRRAEGQPFFAVFNLVDTHEARSWVSPDDTLVTDPDAVEVPPYYPDTPAVRRQLAKHYDNIARMDARVGEILAQLEADGHADDTIVFFWSDHGDGLPRAKRWLYDSGLRVPLIVRWPDGLEPGTVDDRLISLIDLAPTVLSVAGVPVPTHMDGRAFLGPRARPPREYVHGARDRIDGVYDMVRATRDRRYAYVRNYYPEKPYVQLVPFRNRSGIMQELLRLHARGALTGPPALWLRGSRPPEELYDIETDPHQVRNLAGDPAADSVLARMRRETDRWMDAIDDLGRVPEDRMVHQMWLGGPQPVTAAPTMTSRRAEAMAPPDTLDPGAEIDLSSPTHGASVGYTTQPGPDAHWRLYASPITLPPGTTTLRAKAIRYGYRESEETTVTVTVRQP